jgi:protein-disulfide isomerase
MDHNDSSWVDSRMDSLEPPHAWQPDTAAALERFRRLHREAAAARKRRIWFAAAAIAAGIAAVAIVPRMWTPAPGPNTLILPAAFREAGSHAAPIRAEIYSDYQCGHCAAVLTDTVPRLVTDFVKTGKVRLLHRDLPLPQHPYARDAARYVNAAGRIGRYDLAAGQLFRTQGEWAADGNIEARLARVLTSAEMDQLRSNLHDTDAEIDADIEMARRDGVRETPAIVVVANGRRRTLSPVPPYPELKTYLDDALRINCREDPKAARC